MTKVTVLFANSGWLNIMEVGEGATPKDAVWDALRKHSAHEGLSNAEIAADVQIYEVFEGEPTPILDPEWGFRVA